MTTTKVCPCNPNIPDEMLCMPGLAWRLAKESLERGSGTNCSVVEFDNAPMAVRHNVNIMQEMVGRIKVRKWHPWNIFAQWPKHYPKDPSCWWCMQLWERVKDMKISETPNKLWLCHITKEEHD